MTAQSVLKITGVWIGLMTIGYIVGKALSPDFSKKSFVEDFIEQQSDTAFLIRPQRIEFSSSNFVNVLHADTAITVSFNAGRYTYMYIEDSNKVTRLNNLNYDPLTHRSGMKTDEWNKALVLAGLPVGYTLKDVPSVLKGQSSVVSVIAVVTGLAGFGAGLYWGYDNECNFDSELAEKILNDATFWKGVIWRKSGNKRLKVFNGFGVGKATPNNSK